MAAILAGNAPVPEIPCHGAPAENSVGFVLKVSGQWLLVGDKEQTIKAGDQLPAEAKIRPATGGKDVFLLICLYDGSTRRYDMEQRLPKRERESAAHRAWAAVAGRYRGGVVQAASRGQDLLVDGLVRLKDGQVDFAPLMGELPDGTWTFRLRPRKGADKKSDTRPAEARELTVKWLSGESAVSAANGLPPGLYDLQLVNSRTKRPVGNAVCVLICPDKTYSKQSAAFEEAVSLTKSWKDDEADEAAIDFLRAYLEELAQESGT